MKRVNPLTLVILILLLPAALSAVEVNIGSNVGSPAEEIALPVTVNDFVNVAGFQFYIVYSSDLIKVDSVTTSVLTNVTSNTDIVGEISLVWESLPSGTAETLDDGTELFTIHLTVNENVEGDAILHFQDLDVVHENMVFDVNLNQLPLFTTDGIIAIKKSGVEDYDNQIPMTFDLGQNYPNPFNPSTTISYTVEKAADLVLDIYDINGKRVDHIGLGHQQAGNHIIKYHADHLASGVYLYRLSAGDFSQTKSMILVK